MSSQKTLPRANAQYNSTTNLNSGNIGMESLKFSNHYAGLQQGAAGSKLNRDRFDNNKSSNVYFSNSNKTFGAGRHQSNPNALGNIEVAGMNSGPKYSPAREYLKMAPN